MPNHDNPLSSHPPLFIASACIGSGSNQKPPFAHPAELLSFMDRLGIARALVHHAAARDFDPLDGNLQLLDELERCPAARGRLIPAMVVSPVLSFREADLQRLLRSWPVHASLALRAYPQDMRHRLDQLDHLLGQLASYNPVLSVRLSHVADPSEVSRLIHAVPSLRIILTEMMWPQMPATFDLMARLQRVLAETSWMHSDGAISLLAQRYGASHVVLGVGPRAHQGAAIGSLAHADLTPQDRQLVSHGNLDSLFGLPSLPVKTCTAIQNRSRQRTGKLWQTFLQRRPLPVLVIDAHAHLGSQGLWLVRHQVIHGQIRQALADMDRIGIQRMIIAGTQACFSDPLVGHRQLRQALTPHAKRFGIYLVYNPVYDDLLRPRVRRLLDDPMVLGFKLLCSYWRVPLTDPRMQTVWKLAHEHRLPILMHTWDDSYNSPAMLREIVRQYPQAQFLLGHAGGGDRGRQEAVELAQNNPNVFLEWCGSFTSLIPWEQTLQQVNPRQVVFGTDGVLHDLAWELGRLLSLDVPDATIRPILGGNMQRILQLRRGLP